MLSCISCTDFIFTVSVQVEGEIICICSSSQNFVLFDECNILLYLGVTCLARTSIQFSSYNCFSSLDNSVTAH